MKKYLIMLAIFIATNLFASAPDTAWTRTFYEMPQGNSVQQTQDGGYIITGSTYANPPGLPLLRTDSLGNKEWLKTFEGGGTGNCVKVTQDGGYAATGSGGVLLKTDSLGNKEWLKTFGGTTDKEGNSVQQTSDGGYIIVGDTSLGAGYSHVWLLKTDSLGNKEWDKIFTTGDVGESVEQTQDGGYIIGGRTYIDSEGFVVLLIKTDSLGNKEWDKKLGGDGARCVQQTTDGGYILTGDPILLKTDSLGNKEWDGTFLGGEGLCVQQLYDEGYFIVGHGGEYRLLVIRTDALGDTLWTKILGNPDGYHIGYSGQQTSDSGYIIVGETSPVAPPISELWLIKLKPEAGIEEGYRMQETEDRLAVVPNPSGKRADIRYWIPDTGGKIADVKIQVYNVGGRRVETLVEGERKPGNYNVNFAGISGIYFVELIAGSYKTIKKIILL